MESEFVLEEMNFRDFDEIELIESESDLSKWSSESFFEELHRTDSIKMVVRKDFKPIGFVCARLIMNQSRKYVEMEILKIAIRMKFRQKGLAQNLLSECLRKGKDLGVGEVWLEVRKSNVAARKLYEKNGFEVISERKNYYNFPTEDALNMCLKI